MGSPVKWYPSGDVAPAMVSCPACLGSGRQSDRMPIKDALADAETLRENLLYHAHLDGTFRLDDPTWDYAQGGGYARDSASAAFEVVPGLRA